MIKPLHILITGAGSGLGRGLAAGLANKGHSILLADLNKDGLRESADLIARNGGSASTHIVDVTSAAAVSELFRSLGDRRCDVLINNAGLQHVSPIADFPEQRWDLLMDVMLKGTFLITQAALPRMRQNKFGRIINIGSIHSLIASPFKSAYTAAKHGLLGFSKTIALETADANITVNTICPAYVRTPLVDAQIAAQAKSHGITEQEVIDKIMLEPMPKKSFISIEEICGTVEFLISDSARNITGQTIVIDGGWTAR